MRIPRVLISQSLQQGQTLELPKPAAHHLQKVLRLRKGHPVLVFDGNGAEFEGELLDQSRVRLSLPTGREPESPLFLTLIQGISRGQKMDFALQKAVELGVAAIQPVACERSVVQLEGERLEKRLAHWRGVIESACEQSGRTRVPELLAPTKLFGLDACSEGDGYYLDPEGANSLATCVIASSVSLIVGPEGGLSKGETQYLRSVGYRGVRLGPRVLRTETAGIAALAVLQALKGDFCD
jgi:16S rRNA (uracil1498-N3)-methyltransferase